MITWLAGAVRVPLGWVVTLSRLLRRSMRSDVGATPAEHCTCALVCGPFLRGAPILCDDERAKLLQLVEAMSRER